MSSPSLISGHCSKQAHQVINRFAGRSLSRSQPGCRAPHWHPRHHGCWRTARLWRPITNGLMARSARLLSMLMRPSVKYTCNFDHWFRVYCTALPSTLVGGTWVSWVSSHSLKPSSPLSIRFVVRVSARPLTYRSSGAQRGTTFG